MNGSVKRTYHEERVIDLTAMESEKLEAQKRTCEIAKWAAVCLAAAAMIGAVFLPLLVAYPNESTCWLCMGLEAAAMGLWWCHRWIKRNAE